jgi:hypothetical protein
LEARPWTREAGISEGGSAQEKVNAVVVVAIGRDESLDDEIELGLARVWRAKLEAFLKAARDFLHPYEGYEHIAGSWNFRPSKPGLR